MVRGTNFSRTLVVVAHPDDEVISTGGIALKYREQGVRTVLVTCTRGEEGEIVDPELNTPENKARLAELRDVELAEALKVLKISDFHQLGYRDSGMINTPANEHPESFNQADLHVETYGAHRQVSRNAEFVERVLVRIRDLHLLRHLISTVLVYQ